MIYDFHHSQPLFSDQPLGTMKLADWSSASTCNCCLSTWRTMDFTLTTHHVRLWNCCPLSLDLAFKHYLTLSYQTTNSSPPAKHLATITTSLLHPHEFPAFTSCRSLDSHSYQFSPVPSSTSCHSQPYQFPPRGFSRHRGTPQIIQF